MSSFIYFSIVSLLVAMCGAIEDSATPDEAAVEEAGPDTTSTTGCSASIPFPAVPPAAGQPAFSILDNVDPCTVSGYVVGYQSLLKINNTDLVLSL